MNDVAVEYTIDGRTHSFRVAGRLITGGPEVMLDHDVDLSAGTEWRDVGFAVTPFLTPALNQELREGLKEIIRDEMRAAGIDTPEGFDLERYHTLVNDAQHAALIERTRHCFPVERLPVAAAILEKRIGEICKQDVTVHNTAIGKAVFCLRIVRPQSGDNNPPHRDVWLDRLRHGVNIYFAVAGSGPLSSLPMAPGSHRWPESEIERTAEGALINGLAFSVPAVTNSRRGINLTRPDPGPDQVLVFSPYLVHGGGQNGQTDTTRVSLEMRFFRAG